MVWLYLFQSKETLQQKVLEKQTLSSSLILQNKASVTLSDSDQTGKQKDKKNPLNKDVCLNPLWISWMFNKLPAPHFVFVWGTR